MGWRESDLVLAFRKPLLWGRLLGKGRLLEPKSPAEQNSRLRVGIEKETGGEPLVSTRQSPRQFPLPPLHLPSLTRIELFWPTRRPSLYGSSRGSRKRPNAYRIRP